MAMETEELTYKAPKEWRKAHVLSLYPPIPKNTAAVNFDIYDFEMFFNDEPTKDLFEQGKR